MTTEDKRTLNIWKSDDSFEELEHTRKACCGGRTVLSGETE